MQTCVMLFKDMGQYAHVPKDHLDLYEQLHTALVGYRGIRPSDAWINDAIDDASMRGFMDRTCFFELCCRLKS